MTTRADILATYKEHGRVDVTAKLLRTSKERVSLILRQERALRPPRDGHTSVRCERCGQVRHVNPVYDNGGQCRTCRGTTAYNALLEKDPPVIRWERRGLVHVAVEVRDPHKDGEEAA